MGEGHAGPRDSEDSLGRRWSLDYGMSLWGGEGCSQSLVACSKGFELYSKNSDYLLRDFNRK